MNNNPFSPLHPTLKKCKCGFIGTRSQLYKHFDSTKVIHRTMSEMGINESYFSQHGEVPLRCDDPVFLNNSKTPAALPTTPPNWSTRNDHRRGGIRL